MSDRPTEKEINIYVGLTEMQRKWYRSVLEKDIDAVNGVFDTLPDPDFSHVLLRSHWKEGREDSTYEHGYAGV